VNNVQIYSNPDFGEVRTVLKDGEPLFVAADVCRALDLEQVSRAMDRLDDDERGLVKVTHPQSPSKMIEVNAVTEPGLYHLVLCSNKPEAKAFKRWITHDVIPTIRKTGGYVNDERTFVDTYLPFADDTTKALFGQTLAALRQANAKIEEDKPKVIFSDAVSASKTSILVGDLAKLVRQNGVEIGQKRLFAWLRENGYLIHRNGADYNMPTQRSMEMGLFEIKETAIAHSDGHTTISRTPKVTGKGQAYFVNKLMA
jgi:anti-repressor protein